MRRSKEIIVLVVLLVGMIGFVLWYVIDRRAKMQAPPPVAAKTVPPPPVDLTKHDGQTIDFSSGQPVVKDSAADRAAMDQAAREMAEAVKGVTFGPPSKKAAEPAKKPLPGNPAEHGVSGTNTGPAAAGNGAPPEPPKKN